ncbi:hypothetical protein [Pseudomonas kuykendallii]|uniref:hypothetical protein n=1 Tax=Pseudomonas kuykendallii TaxID=1007099 RepID=UPI0028D1F5CB|nr:hypothetical protein [Pseudomonas kuykendallii]
MSLPIMLGGVPIVLLAGAPDQSSEPLGGETVVRMSNGQGVKMSHWAKESGSISGQGWMPAGLDGLDYSQPLELRLALAECITGSALQVPLTSTPRQDAEPWCVALIGDTGQWAETPCSFADGVVTITPAAGATLYATYWYPVYQVFASKPPKSQSAGSHGWTITWEEA